MSNFIHVVVVGGSPEAPEPELLRSFAMNAQVVVAVDRGLDVLLAAGLDCDLFCGDADSISPEGAALVRAAEAGERVVSGGAPCVRAVERYNPHKDYTDLSLALRAIDERWPQSYLTVTGVCGGRPDHFLGVVGRLATCDKAIDIVENGFRGTILQGGSSSSLSGCAGKRFSFIPLSPEGAEVSIAGMRWNLDHKYVDLLSDLGISNVIEAEKNASISCHAGTLVAFCELGTETF